jgi:putative addiction module component (TIGR02574 family)
MATIETPALSDGLTPELLERALKLSRADRELLVLRLNESLEDQDDPTEVAEAWGREIENRLDDVKQGRVQLVEFADMMEEARKRIAARKSP